MNEILIKKLQKLTASRKSSAIADMALELKNDYWQKHAQSMAAGIVCALKDKGWSQDFLAKKLGVPLPQVQEYTKGTKNLTLKEIGPLEKVLSVNLIGTPAENTFHTFDSYVVNGVYKGPEIWEEEINLNGDSNLYQENTWTSLGCLKKVTKGLTLRNLPFLEDLGDLEVIEGELNFVNLMKLKSLGNLTEIGRRAHFVNLPNLLSLGRLARTRGDVQFRFTPKLEDVSSLRRIGGNLALPDAAINNLCALKSIVGILHIPLGVRLSKRIFGVKNIWVAKIGMDGGLFTYDWKEYVAEITKIDSAKLTDLPKMLNEVDFSFKPFIKDRLKGVKK